jgi:hypothetical protein
MNLQPSDQLTLPYMPLVDRSLAGNRTPRRKLALKRDTPADYEAVREAVTRMVFTRNQAVELVGQILDNVK